MRFVPALALLLLAAPALAQYWTHYANVRFGYEIDVPPGFEAGGESANGDGQMFYDLDGERGVTVWGGQLLEDFAQEVSEAIALAGAENWAISQQTKTPQWADFSGQQGHRRLFQRMITLCDGASYAAFRAEYNISDLNAMEPVLQGLARSFVAKGC
ncbi:hypothetical protein O9Z70_02540 [Devosia sp. YIM 151766]|uniref:hypothetical protein n=1 Tax=Devosia sp. YIM 151766 TaxID=3017325 RepID=UPI00255CB456|nr:hypothetical protein [Devosia sp. YIM 151766]WIY53434.1 hypothetical protein O9Z70_02540 [Devosia sp. YIM 151766]